MQQGRQLASDDAMMFLVATVSTCLHMVPMPQVLRLGLPAAPISSLSRDFDCERSQLPASQSLAISRTDIVAPQLDVGVNQI